MSWRHRALCFGADPSIFVPETCPEPVTFPPPIVTALCPVCPVRDECESYGRTSASSGWWGGSFLFWGMAMDEWKPWIVRPTAELQCVVCGDTFTSVQTTAIYCTNRCQMREFRARRRSRNTAERAIIQLPDSAGNSNPVDSTEWPTSSAPCARRPSRPSVPMRCTAQRRAPRSPECPRRSACSSRCHWWLRSPHDLRGRVPVRTADPAPRLPWIWRYHNAIPGYPATYLPLVWGVVIPCRPQQHRWSAGLPRRVTCLLSGGQVVVGSNPASPTKHQVRGHT
jgi:hypothetical protein